MKTRPVDALTQSIVELLTEAYIGPPDANFPTWFNDNDPDAGVFRLIQNVSAAEASISADRTGNPGTTAASHIEHLRWSLANASGAIRGEEYQTNWKTSWTVTTVSDEAWKKLEEQLEWSIS